METSKLSVKEKIGYGMGDAGCNIIFGAIMLFVNYFYTDIFGLAPALVGVLLLSVRVIDAVTDPIMGAMADRTRSKYGRFRPWLLWMAFPYALFSVLMFYHPRVDVQQQSYLCVCHLLPAVYHLHGDQYSLLLTRQRHHQRPERACRLSILPLCAGGHCYPATFSHFAADG